MTFLREHVTGTQLEQADWLDAVIVALDVLRSADSEREARKKYTAMKVRRLKYALCGYFPTALNCRLCCCLSWAARLKRNSWSLSSRCVVSV